MTKSIPSASKVVVIGGGVAGCSVAYHLDAELIPTLLKKYTKRTTKPR